MGKIKELQIQFLNEVAKYVGKYGFSEKYKGQAFFKPTDFGKLVIHFSFIQHVNDFDITIDIAIRFNDLEDLINRSKDYLSEKQKKDTFSIGCELGNLAEGEQKRWTIENSEDVPNVVSEIMSFFEKVGIPYFEKYSDKRVVRDLVLKDDRSVWIHSALHGKRAATAVGLTFILDSREKALDLAKVKEQFLIERKDFGLEDFRKFVKSL